ncbi:MAG: 4'-phosphopantetheinyl transferase superfamily protein [Deltaproteobacteria bacterium]|nr:4'-phosphopantetheinyl transferase superfamily protein [Deltaproteobacteria bacterium]
MFHVGNDIVDLTNPRSRKKVDDVRFINRVLAAEEQGQLLRSDHPFEILWSFWAGKETAYKICRKLDLRAAFSPRLYRIRFHDPEESHERKNDFLNVKALNGTVSTKCGVIHIRVVIRPDFVHCVGTEDPSSLGMVAWEWDRLKNPAPDNDTSLFVRKMAVKGLSDWSGQRSEDIEIKRFKGVKGLGPPLVYIKGEPSGIDISLSHDGPFCAYAFSRQGSGQKV